MRDNIVFIGCVAAGFFTAGMLVAQKQCEDSPKIEYKVKVISPPGTTCTIRNPQNEYQCIRWKLKKEYYKNDGKPY